jgi:hypothetical protein
LAAVLLSSFVVLHLYPEGVATVLRSGAQRFARRLRPHRGRGSRTKGRRGTRPPQG